MKDQDNEPAPVADGCGLIPYIPRASVASITVRRLIQTATGAESSVVLPRRFTVADDEVTVAAWVGGGLFRATARDHSGRYLQGYSARTFGIDGPEILLDASGATSPEGAAPPPAPAAPAAAPPLRLASQGVPIASALPGMPTVALDIPDLPPEMRAFLSVHLSGMSFVVDAVTRARDVAVDSNARAADAERESARNAVGLAKSFMDTISGPRMKADGEALAALTGVLADRTRELAEARAESERVRSAWHTAEVDRARLLVILQSGGQMPVAGTPGWRGFVEKVAGLVVGIIGPGALGIVAHQLGMNPEQFAALTAAAYAGHPAGNVQASAPQLEKSGAA